MNFVEGRKMTAVMDMEKIDLFLKWVMGMGILGPTLGFIGGVIALLLDGPETVVIIASVTTINVMIVYSAYEMRKELSMDTS
jgi:hypothetical protein